MTMVNGVLQGGAAYLYGDTALVDPTTGYVLAFDCKIRTRTDRHFPWAVGVTAMGNYGAQLAALELFDAKRVDDMVEQMPLVIATFKELSAPHHDHLPIIRLLLAAWDEDCGVTRLFVAGDGHELKGSDWCPPGVTEVGYFFGDEADPTHHWQGGTPSDPTFFDVEKDGLAVFETRRRTPSTPFDGCMAPGNYVGGTVQMVKVSRGGVEALQLHEWPDVIGKPIGFAATFEPI